MPVAVQVEHDPRLAAREPSAEQDRRDVVRSVHEDRVGLEVAKLTCDAHRERQVKGEAVEQARSDGLDEMERVVVRRIGVDRAGEHAHVRDVVQRVELLLRRGGEGHAIPRSPDEQNAQRLSPPLVLGHEGTDSFRVLLRSREPLLRSCLRDQPEARGELSI